ncbi:GA module-containing protein [Mycoplasmopsis gallopavonis]|uniref:ECM-binding protein homolog n=1 Tax=Mycoplasmopsis gallopavonis TaxID=76629 RepID=A0A449AYN1_9BACT|nr:GA module-containing protein [Mycoplasmopsis gallopavonis]RIV16518.1 hypothetical protein D1113_02060 [Mycoplasmopsis gallopavonis]VEU72587.1 ECM-binding protein homolog [Mycoplasmopsis gallopavonis]
MKKSKRILLPLSIMPIMAPVAILSASNVIAGNNDNTERLSNVPNETHYIEGINGDHKTFDNSKKNSYYYNLVGGTTSFAFRYKAAPLVETQIGDEREWQEPVQNWTVTVNKNPTFPRKFTGESTTYEDGPTWSANPRFAVAISKGLEIIPGSLSLEVWNPLKGTDTKPTFEYKNVENTLVPFTQTGILERTISANFWADQDNWNRWNKAEKTDNYWNLYFSDWAIFNESTHKKDDQNIDLNYWNAWKKDRNAEPGSKIWEALHLWDQIALVTVNRSWRTPMRAVFLENDWNPGWASGWAKTNEWTDITKQFQDDIHYNIGEIIGFDFDTSTWKGDNIYSQNYFVIKFQTRKNKDMLLLNNPNLRVDNIGNKAYVMSGFSTFDHNTYVGNWDWEMVDIDKRYQNFSVDIKENIIKNSSSEVKKLPKLNFTVSGTNVTGRRVGIVTTDLSTTNTNKIQIDNSKRSNDTSYWSRNYSSLYVGSQDLNEEDFNYSRQWWAVRKNWELSYKYIDPLEDFWDISVSKSWNEDLDRMTYTLNYYFNELKYKKVAAEKYIYDKTNLTNAQKEALVNEIKRQTNDSDIEKVKTKADQLDQAQKTLLDTLNALKVNPDMNRDSKNYKLASDSLKQIYDQVLNEANTATNKTSAPFKNLEEVNALTSKIKNLQLDGKLFLDNALAHLDQYKNNISSDLYNTTKAEMEAAQTRNDVNASLNKLSEFMDVIDKLKKAAAAGEQTKSTSLYSTSTAEKKKALDTALQDVENKIANSSKARIINKDIWDRLKQNYLNSIKKVYDAIAGLGGLKETLKEEIKKYPEEFLPSEDKNQILDKIEKDTIDSTDKMNEYLKEAYDKAAENAKKVIDSLNNLNEDQKNEFKQKIDDAKNSNNYNLDQLKEIIADAKKVNDAQKFDMSKFDELQHLTNAQKQHWKAEVEKKANEGLAAQNEVYNKAVELDHLMLDLNNLVNSAKQIKEANNTTYSKASNKDAFDQALTNATNAVNKANTNNQDKATINQYLAELTKQKDALDGQIVDLKEKINDKNVVNILNDNQRNEVIALIGNKKDNDLTNELLIEIDKAIITKDKANLNAELEKAKAKGLDPEKINEFKNKIDNINLDKATNPWDKTAKELMDEIDKTNKELDELAKKKEELKAKIDSDKTWTHLNPSQKEQFKQQIENAKTMDDLNALENTIDQIDTQMDKLKKAFDAIPESLKPTDSKLEDGTTITNPDFTLATEKKLKDDYLKALQNVNKALIDTDTSNSYNEQTIKDLIDKLNTTKNALNGEETLKSKKDQIKAKIDTIPETSLSNADKDKLKAKVDAASTIQNTSSNSDGNNNQTNWNSTDSIDTFVDKLKKSLNDLKTNVDGQDAVQNTENYRNSTDAAKKQYDDSIADGKNVLNNNKTPDNDWDSILSNIDQKNSAINQAKQNLNGDDQLPQSKTQAIQKLNDYKYLNNKQKEELQTKINSAQEINTINQILNTANSLNDAMKALLDAYDKHNGREANPAKGLKAITEKRSETSKFINATNRSPYLNALNQANIALNAIENRVVLDPQALTKLANEIESTYASLNGEQTLNSYKEEAKKKIDSDFTNLNNEQKQDLKNKINNAKTEAEIDQILKDAANQNKNMGDLLAAIDTATGKTQTNQFKNSSPQVQQELLAKIQKAKEQAQNHNLTNEEIQELINELNGVALDGDQRLKEKLDQLQNKVNELTPIKQTDKYKQASNLDKTSFDQALEDAQNNINHPNYDKLSLDDVQRMIDKLEQVKNNLLDDKNKRIEDEIKGLDNLTDQEKQHFIDQMKQTSDNNAKEDILDQAKELNDHKQNIIDKIKEAQNSGLNNDEANKLINEVKKADGLNHPEKLNELENKVQNIIDKISEVENKLNELNPTSSLEQINQIKDLIENLKDLKVNTDQFKKVIDNLEQVQKFPNILKEFEDLRYDDPSLETKKEQVLNALNALKQLDNNYTNNKLAQIALTIQDAIEQNEAAFNLDLALLNALKTNEYTDELREAINNANSKNANRFPNFIHYFTEASRYLNSIKKIEDHIPLREDEIDIIKNLNDQALNENLVNVIKSWIDDNNTKIQKEAIVPKPEKKPYEGLSPWWWVLLFLGTLGIGALVAYLVTNKK